MLENELELGKNYIKTGFGMNKAGQHEALGMALTSNLLKCEDYV